MKLKGIINLGGTINEVIIYKTAYGYVARRHAPVSAERMATDPAFQRTRESAAIFGKAAKAAKLVRKAFYNKLLQAKDCRLTGRLTREMMKVIKADTTSEPAMRNAMDGNLELLEGFNFNAGSQLAASLHAPYLAVIDRPTGRFTVSLKAFAPAHMIKAPDKATHYRISALAAEIDFGTGIVHTDTQETTLLPLDNKAVAAISLQSTLTPASRHPLFLALGIEFMQVVNDEYLPVQEGAFNSLALVKVLKG